MALLAYKEIKRKCRITKVAEQTGVRLVRPYCIMLSYLKFVEYFCYTFFFF